MTRRLAISVFFVLGLYRLAMWRFPHDERPETPMPPANAFRRLQVSRDLWPNDPDPAMLEDCMRETLESQTGETPRLEAFMQRGYQNLRDCLPGSGSSGTEPQRVS